MRAARIEVEKDDLGILRRHTFGKPRAADQFNRIETDTTQQLRERLQKPEVRVDDEAKRRATRAMLRRLAAMMGNLGGR